MLIQLQIGDVVYNVYLECKKSDILNKVQREDMNELKVGLTRCVSAWLSKLNSRYGKRSV